MQKNNKERKQTLAMYVNVHVLIWIYLWLPEKNMYLSEWNRGFGKEKKNTKEK